MTLRPSVFDMSSLQIPFESFDLRTLTIFKTLSKAVSERATATISSLNVGDELLDDLIRHEKSQTDIIRAYTDFELLEIVKSLHQIFGDRIYIIGNKINQLQFTSTFVKVGDVKYTVSKKVCITFSTGIHNNMQELIETVRKATSEYTCESVQEIQNLCDDEYDVQNLWLVHGCQAFSLCYGEASKTTLFDITSYNFDEYSVKKDNLRNFILEFVNLYNVDVHGDIKFK